MTPGRLLARARIALAIPALWLLAGPVRAAEPLNAATSLLKVLIVLAVIVAMIFAAGWFVRRYGVPGQTRSAGMLRPLDTLHLGPRERIVLLAIGEQRMVVGLNGTQMTPLGQFHAEQLGELPETPEPAPAASASVKFADALRVALGKPSATPVDGAR